MPVPNAPTRRHRDPRQPQQSQGGGSRGSDHRDRSHRTLSATVLSGSEPDRKVLFQTQGAAPPSRATRYRSPLEGNRGVAQYGLSKRMHKLLCLLRICMHLNQKRSKLELDLPQGPTRKVRSGASSASPPQAQGAATSGTPATDLELRQY